MEKADVITWDTKGNLHRTQKAPPEKLQFFQILKQIYRAEKHLQQKQQYLFNWRNASFQNTISGSNHYLFISNTLKL